MYIRSVNCCTCFNSRNPAQSFLSCQNPPSNFQVCTSTLPTLLHMKSFVVYLHLVCDITVKELAEIYKAFSTARAIGYCDNKRELVEKLIAITNEISTQ